eukprot:scaffold41_cov100-Skeletonema_dohrnii-CCMP3373.AAC.4
MINSTSLSLLDGFVDWSILADPSTIETCRQSLKDDGVMLIPNFVTPAGITHLKEEISSCPHNESTQHYTPYQDQGDFEKYPASHPRNYKLHSSASFVGRKSLEATTKVQCISMYNDERVVDFVSNILGHKLYRSKDENGSVYSYRITSNHNPPWHFDESHYTMILYLQSSESGGEFEYVPWCRPTRSVDDEDGHDIIHKILIEKDDNNNDDLIQQVHPQDGMLLFFGGAQTFHRAAPIQGKTARIGLVFTFSEGETFRNSDDVKSSNQWDPADF